MDSTCLSGPYNLLASFPAQVGGGLPGAGAAGFTYVEESAALGEIVLSQLPLERELWGV